MDDATCGRIIEGLLEGRCLTQICRDAGMPSVSTVRRILNGSNPEQVMFRERYLRALEIREMILMDEMPAVIDDRSRDWVERRNEDGEPYMARNPEALRQDKLLLAAMQKEVEGIERRRPRAAERPDAPAKYVITTVNFMDLPEEYRAGCRRHPNEPPRSSD